MFFYLFILCFGPINHRKNSFCLSPDTRERARDRRGERVLRTEEKGEAYGSIGKRTVPM
jgi:hypothetical protein